MGANAREFVCLSCGSHDFGKYCSGCGAPLNLTPSQAPALLVRWLVSTGYERLAIQPANGNGPRQTTPIEGRTAEWVPAVIVDDLAASMSECPRSQVEFLAFDRTNIRQAEIVAVVDGAAIDDQQIRRLAETMQAKLQTRKEALKKPFKLKTVSLVFYLVLPDGRVRDRIEALRARFPRHLTFGYGVRVSFVGLSLKDADFYPNSLVGLDPEKRQILQSVLAQLQLDATLENQSRPASAWRALVNETLKPTENLRKFAWIFWSLATKPMFYAGEIERGRITFATALSYLALVLVFVCLTEKVIGLRELTSLDIFPLLDGVLLFSFVVAVQAAVAAVMFAALKAVGGKGSYEKTLITQLLLTVILIPVSTMIDSVTFLANSDYYNQLTVTPGVRAQNSFNAMYLIPMTSVVHKVSRFRVSGALVLMGLAVGAVVVMGAAAFA